MSYVSETRRAIEDGRLRFGISPDGRSRSLWADEEAFKNHIRSCIQGNSKVIAGFLRRMHKTGGKVDPNEVQSMLGIFDQWLYLAESESVNEC